METIPINNINQAYNRRGTGTPLLLIHGFPLDHTIWEKTVRLLEDRFDLILPDLRGFGGSSTVETQYSMEDLAADLAGLLTHMQIEKAVVAGHSMGGYLALAFARRYPERMLGLGLVSSQLPADPPDRKEGRYKTASDVAEKGVVVVADAMAPKLTAKPALVNQLHKLIQNQSPAGVIGALKAMAERSDSTSLITGLRYPIVLVHGDKDVLIPIERAREARAAQPEAKLLELADVGHMPMMEAPFETAWALKQLIR